MIGASLAQNQRDVFRPLLADFIDMDHDLVRLAQNIDWNLFENEFAGFYTETGQLAMPIRLMVDCLMLKRLYNLEDEILVEALYVLGEKDFVRQEFIKLLEHDDSIVREFALNAIDSLDDESRQIKDVVIAMSKRTDGLKWVNQDHRIVLNLLEEWNVDAGDVGLEIDMGWIENISP